MKETLQEIKAVTECLHKATDSAVELFDEVAKILNRWGVGVEVRYTYNPDRVLAFSRWKRKKFRFAVIDNTTADTTLIEHLPQFEKLDAVAALPLLLRDLLALLQAEVGEVSIPKISDLTDLGRLGKGLKLDQLVRR